MILIHLPLSSAQNLLTVNNQILLCWLLPNPYPNRRTDRAIRRFKKLDGQREKINELFEDIMDVANEPRNIEGTTPLQKATSIAFPLVGGGKLDYPRGVVADQALSYLITYFRNNSGPREAWMQGPRVLTDLYFFVKPGGNWESRAEQIAWQNAWR